MGGGHKAMQRIHTPYYPGQGSWLCSLAALLSGKEISRPIFHLEWRNMSILLCPGPWGMSSLLCFPWGNLGSYWTSTISRRKYSVLYSRIPHNFLKATAGRYLFLPWLRLYQGKCKSLSSIIPFDGALPSQNPCQPCPALQPHWWLLRKIFAIKVKSPWGYKR